MVVMMCLGWQHSAEPVSLCLQKLVLTVMPQMKVKKQTLLQVIKIKNNSVQTAQYNETHHKMMIPWLKFWMLTFN